MLALALLTLLEAITLQGPLHHVQGIDVEDGVLWVSSVERATRKGYLFRIDRRSGKILASVEVQDGERFHPGGIALDGDDLWVPIAEYKKLSSAWIERRDKRTLALRSRFAVEDHIGCVAAAGGRVYGGNWDSLQIYTWTRDGQLERVRDNPSGTRYQDLKSRGGMLVGGGLREKGSGAIDWLHEDTLALERRIPVATTDRGVVYTNEGMTIVGERLYLLPEDDPSRLFVFRVP
jgi:hypothetical protein